jgi:hypothetical protein
MYTQFFAGFLLDKGVLSPKTLLEILALHDTAKVNLGTLAVNAGLISEEDAEKVHIEQTHGNRRFGDIALDMGFLTPQQIDELITMQPSPYHIFGYLLYEQEVLSNSSLRSLRKEFETLYHLEDADFYNETEEKMLEIIRTRMPGHPQITDTAANYIVLYFHNLVRFLGDDFLPMSPQILSEYEGELCTIHEVEDAVTIYSVLAMSEKNASSFANRYTHEELYGDEEMIHAALCDFLNLQNNVFLEELPCERESGKTLNPPEIEKNRKIERTEPLIDFPILTSTGEIHFLFQISEGK